MLQSHSATRDMEEGGKEEDEQLCPLCYESMDLTEKHFRPCKCGYQVCLWCFHDLFEKLNGKCPACRTPYNKERLESTALDPKLVAVAKEEKKRRKEKQKPPMDRLSSIKQLQTRELLLSKGVQSSVDSDLQNVRIVQRNLVYVIGIPPQIAREEILRKKEYFGKFGRIIKIAINKKQMVGVGPKSSCSAYVTFKRDEDASAAIEEFNGRIIDGRTLKATFGTTKYCSFFLRNLVCSNPGCLYLHEFARPEDCFTKEDLVIIEKMGSLQYFQSSLAARSGVCFRFIFQSH